MCTITWVCSVWGLKPLRICFDVVESCISLIVKVIKVDSNPKLHTPLSALMKMIESNKIQAWTKQYYPPTICVQLHIVDSALWRRAVIKSRSVPSKLEPLEASAVIAALEDGITKLDILYQTIPVERGPQIEESYKGIEDRFQNEVMDSKKCWECAGLWPMDVQAMLKLQKDRTFAERVLRKTVEDLRCDYSFGALHGAMALMNAKTADEKLIEDKLRTSKENEDMYKEYLASEKELMIRQDKFWNKKEEELLAASHDTRLVSGLALDFVRHWEDTRRQQLNLMKHRQEESLQNEIDDILDSLLVQEERAHMEIIQFLQGEHEFLKRDLDRWTDEYDDQIATRDAELNVLRQNKEANLEAMDQAKREMEIRKEVKTRALELREKFDKKKYALEQVTIIQAWWRGIYYRKNLQDKAVKLLKAKNKPIKGKKGKKK